MLRTVWQLAAIAVLTPFAIGCAGRYRTAVASAVELPPHVRFLSQTRLCSHEATAGDTVHAVLIAGGELLVPPADSGAAVRFVVQESRSGLLSDDSRRPLFRLVPATIETRDGVRPLVGDRIAIEYRPYVPLDTDTLHVCLARGSRMIVLPPN